MTARSIITSKGQVTIPKPVREALGVAEADAVEFEIRGGEAVLRPIKQTFLGRYASVPPRNRPEQWRRVRERVAKDVSRRATRARRA